MDDALSREMAEWLETRPAQRGADFRRGDSRSGPAQALPGAHNAQNAAAAAAMARALGVPEAAIAEGIASFPGLPHRQQEVAMTRWRALHQ